MIKRLTILLAFSLAACGQAQDSTAPAEKPMRIVSLDYCADQYLLELVNEERILAVSPHARDSYSYHRDRAKGVRQIRPLAEDILILKPDLVIRSYGGGPQITKFFEQAGVSVLQIGYASSMDDIKTVLSNTADGLGESEKADALIADMEARLAALKPQAEENRGKALYMASGGVTTGPGSLIHEMILAAGYENFQKEPGWKALPLERLVYDQPDVIAAAFFEEGTDYLNTWSASGHPVAQKQLRDRPVVPLDGAWTSCGSWYLVDAIEALAKAGIQVEDGA